MIFVFGVGVFCFLIDNLALNDMTLISGVDMNASVSIETCVTHMANHSF
jgi:hypothetical protein